MSKVKAIKTESIKKNNGKNFSKQFISHHQEILQGTEVGFVIVERNMHRHAGRLLVKCNVYKQSFCHNFFTLTARLF